MYKEELVEKIKALFGERLTPQGFVLVDARFYKNQRGELILEALVDRQFGGIVLSECAYLNKELGAILDEMDLGLAGLALEVSSPGVDRPLVAPGDFQRVKSRQIRVFLKEAVEEKIEYMGVLEAVEGDVIVLRTTVKTIQIPLAKINKAKQVIL